MTYPSFHRRCSFNHGQNCSAGSRIFVQESIYEKFLDQFTEKARAIKVGDPFSRDTYQGPQVSTTQFEVRASTLITKYTLTVRKAHHGIHNLGHERWCYRTPWW
jgi:aldehyde dehydrogenase (NAD+)